MISRVTERGQITIDREARERLGVRPGMIAYQRIVSGRLEVIFLPVPHRRSLAGALRREGEERGVLTRAELEEAVKEALARDEATTRNDG